MSREIDPQRTSRASAFDLWMKAPNPMVTLIKTLDVTRLRWFSRRSGLKCNMLLCWCVGRAAEGIREFYTLPVGQRLIQYDALAVSVIVKNSEGGINSCDIPFHPDLNAFNRAYLEATERSASRCENIEITDRMVIGTSAIVETELDGAVSLYSGIYNNPYLVWGRFRRRLLRYEISLSFQFHHTQMDGGHAGQFLERLQQELRRLGA